MSRPPARGPRVAPLLMAFALALAACGAAPGTQFLPIGSRCNRGDDCGTSPFNSCATEGFPGGYCDRECITDGDCPMDATCMALRCRRKCTLDTQCREADGYACKAAGATSKVCLPR